MTRVKLTSGIEIDVVPFTPSEVKIYERELLRVGAMKPEFTVENMNMALDLLYVGLRRSIHDLTQDALEEMLVLGDCMNIIRALVEPYLPTKH